MLFSHYNCLYECINAAEKTSTMMQARSEYPSTSFTNEKVNEINEYDKRIITVTEVVEKIGFS